MIQFRQILKQIFVTGYKPTQNDFSDVFDTFVSKADDPIITTEEKQKIADSLTTETDPIFEASPAADITTNHIIYLNNPPSQMSGQQILTAIGNNGITEQYLSQDLIDRINF